MCRAVGMSRLMAIAFSLAYDDHAGRQFDTFIRRPSADQPTVGLLPFDQPAMVFRGRLIIARPEIRVHNTKSSFHVGIHGDDRIHEKPTEPEPF